MTERRVRRRTLDSYELNVRRILPYLGSVQLQRLTPAFIQSAYDRLLASGLSKYSLVQVHGVLAPALEHAFRWGLVSRNPAVWVSVPRPQAREMTALTSEQLRRLFDSSRQSGWYPLWVLLGTAGLRISGALGLFWTDVDLVGRRLQVRRVLQRRRGRGLVFAEPKTSTSRRSVCLTALGTAALADHREAQLAMRDRLAWNHEDLVFPDRRGRRLESGNVNRVLAIALDRAGLPHIRVHDLRHTAASVLLVSGVHPKAVQELLGHSTITTTLNTYSHLTPLLHQEAIARLDEVLANVST